MSTLFQTWIERAISVATQLPGSGVGHSTGAGSPFSDYDAFIVIYTFMAAFLVFTLLAGAFLIINLGLLSKRPGDEVGKRTPSDLGILKSRLWPQEPVMQHMLPAEEDEYQEAQKQREAKEIDRSAA
jgi:hypothetical protein